MTSYDYISWLMTTAPPEALQQCVKKARECLRGKTNDQFCMFGYIDTMFGYVCDHDVDVDQHLFLIYTSLCTSIDFVDYMHSRGVPATRLAMFVRMCQSMFQHLLCGHEVHYLFTTPRLTTTTSNTITNAAPDNQSTKKLTCFRHVVSELRNMYHMLLPN